MRFNIVNRRIHYWGSIAFALPVLVIISSGLLLQLKKHWDFVQPPEQRGSTTVPAVSLDEVLAAVATVPAADVSGWDDVNRIDLRPDRGVAKVWTRNGWEVQVDLGTGQVLHAAFRRSDLIESIHDGSAFAGDWSKLGVFLPAGLALLGLLLSGVWMFWVPLRAKRQARERRQVTGCASPPVAVGEAE